MIKELRTPFFTVLFILLGLFLYTKLAGPISFSVNSVQTTKQDFFRVEATGKATAIPTTAKLSLGITKTAPTLKDAQNQANTVMNKILADLKGIGVEEKQIKTTSYNVSPSYDFSNGKQTITGYTVSQNIEVQVTPTDKANQITDFATAAGANLVGGIEFILDDQAQKQLEEKARKEAIEKAKEKAQSLADAAGIKLGKIIDVQEWNNQPIDYNPMGLSASEKSVEAPTQLSPGESSVSLTISLSYETR